MSLNSNSGSLSTNVGEKEAITDNKKCVIDVNRGWGGWGWVGAHLRLHPRLYHIKGGGHKRGRRSRNAANEELPRHPCPAALSDPRARARHWLADVSV